MSDDYTKNLEEIIKAVIKPFKNIPFKLVMEAISGYKILPFEREKESDFEILTVLKKVAKEAGEEVNKIGIKRSRPNEVGNDIESFVKNALNKNNFKASIPKTEKGQAKSVGYPDIEFLDQEEKLNYLECKVYNKDNIDTTFRSFYVSPSEEFKVTKDAHHFLISYEYYKSGQDGNKNIYKVKKWKILTIENLLVDIKFEFNSDNKRLYDKKNILAEGVLI